DPMRRFLILALLIAVCAASAGQARADSGGVSTVDIGIAPSKLQLRLIPGRTVHTSIRAYNKGSKAVTLDVYPQNYTVHSESDVDFKPSGTLPGSAGPWTTLSASVMRIPGHSERTLGLTIVVPKDAPLGTHTLAVVFRSRTIQTSSGGLRYQPAVAS